MGIGKFEMFPKEEPQGPAKPLFEVSEEEGAEIRRDTERRVNQERKAHRREFLEKIATAAGVAAAGAGVYRYFTEESKDAPSGNSGRDYLQSLVKEEGLGDRQASELQERIQIAERFFGPWVFQVLRNADGVARREARAMPLHPPVSGFERAGLSNKDVSRLIAPGLYPKGVIQGNVRRIIYTHELITYPSLSKSGNLAAAGEAFVDGTIRFYRYTKDEDDPDNARQVVANLPEHLTHESGHRQDWQSSFRLKGSERISFLAEAALAHKTSIYGDPDELLARYPEFHHMIAKSSKQQRDYDYLVEWWAVLCNEACNHPDDFIFDATQREKDLIIKWFVRGDKAFDFQKAFRLRQRIQAELERKAAR